MNYNHQQIKAILHFNGQWRSYQKRVLDRSWQYLQDRRIHIVAAPGSGKTTLGIELIRRLNAPCLILSPSVNIRDQWLSRIREAYISQEEPAGLLSSSIKEPGIITAITYQALHSGMTKTKDTDPDQSEENIDYSDFDFFATVQSCGIRTICLDEAHHLRSEWWKALEEMIGKMPDATVISLTATPPYDSTPAQWERYIGLCGPIDEEIIVPELVKEGSLCPHQDYVYFNVPTKEEEEAVKKFVQEAKEKADALFRDEEFGRIISTHKGLAAPKESADLFLQKPEYLSSLLVFLQAKQIAFSRELLQMLGEGGTLPAMTMKWMEILLQGFLFEDTESFSCTKEYREGLMADLKAHGLIQKNKVCLTANDTINKLLVTSKGKINSILEVTKAEYENLGSDLRLLILTDYIKKEYIQAVGETDKSVNELGVIPLFENLRRTFSGVRNEKNTTSAGERITAGDLRIGVLSGSVVVIPQNAEETLQRIMEERHVKGVMKELSDTGYIQVSISGTEHTASSLVTELFGMGEVRVLIGTKSLLGEGWDSPCINSLILASFVGSFMLSNQMRGRAIRVMRNNPDKVSNIWHLICMQPESVRAEEETEDFSTLKRRFEGFLGLYYEKDSIENGLGRLSYIKGPYTAPLLEKINEKMLAMAGNRPMVKKRWEDCLAPLDKMEVAVEAGASKEFFQKGMLFYKTLAGAVLLAALFLFCLIRFFPAFGMFLSGHKVSALLKLFLWGIGGGISGALMGAKVSYLRKTATPGRYMKAIGGCILSALKQLGSITDKNTAVAVDESGEDGMSFIYLRGGSEREKDVFAKCVCEFLGLADNQRYLLKAQQNVPRLCIFYCVPELFGKRKEDAEMFHAKVRRYIGKYSLHYTKSAEGKKLLLTARVYSLANKNPDYICKKKKVRSS